MSGVKRNLRPPGGQKRCGTSFVWKSAYMSKKRFLQY